MNKKHLIFIFVLVLLGTAFAINTVSTGYRINVGEYKFISSQFSQAKKVTNNCADPVFIPTKTDAAWQSVLNHKPTCVDISALGSNDHIYPKTSDGSLIGDTFLPNLHVYADYYCLIHGFGPASEYHHEDGAGRVGCECSALVGCDGEECYNPATYILRDVTCDMPVNQPCTLDGVTVADGDDRTFFLNEQDKNCLLHSQLRTCINGVLDGDIIYDKAHCSPIGGDCPFPCHVNSYGDCVDDEGHACRA